MMITKLMQWLIGVGLFLAVWSCLLFDFVKCDVVQTHKDIILHLPIYLVISFGCYSLAVVGYRTATFNDCPEAAKELREEIEEARKDLRKRGVKMDS